MNLNLKISPIDKVSVELQNLVETIVDGYDSDLPGFLNQEKEKKEFVDEQEMPVVLQVFYEKAEEKKLQNSNVFFNVEISFLGETLSQRKFFLTEAIA